jgi:hypothetical protein
MHAEAESQMEQRHRQDMEKVKERCQQDREETKARCQYELEEAEDRHGLRIEQQMQYQSKTMQLMMMSMIDGCTNKRKGTLTTLMTRMKKMIRLVVFVF